MNAFSIPQTLQAAASFYAALKQGKLFTSFSSALTNSLSEQFNWNSVQLGAATYKESENSLPRYTALAFLDIFK